MSNTMQTSTNARTYDGGNKSASWHTAFYYLAEHLREITHGALNHKGLYAFFSPKGRYINHSNPVVRKRTAGTLSRIVHTKRYAQDMRDSYLLDGGVFDRAAESVCETVSAAQGYSDAELREWLFGTCWPDIRRGLVNEAGEWRRNLSLSRLDCEMSMLFSSCRQSSAEEDGLATEVCSVEEVLAAMLHVMAFDHLDVGMARSLVDRGFSSDAFLGERSVAEDRPVNLIKFADSNSAAFAGIWSVSKDTPFVIGRYTDCDAFELSEEVSRIHCRILWEDGAWCLEDLSSRNGSVVHRKGANVHVPYVNGAGSPFRLEFGDAIELPDGSTYLFAECVL